MLRLEDNRQYIVFPSWLKVAYNWEDLPGILSNPLKYDKMGTQTYGINGLKSLGFPEEVQPADLLNGPLGGGIIVPHIRKDERWLPYHVLGFNNGATLTTPRTLLHYDKLQYSVGFLEHCTHPGNAYQHSKKPKNFDCVISAEHVDNTGDKVFWLMTVPQGKMVPGINELPKWINSFGCILEKIPFENSYLAQETSNWRGDDLSYSCFKVEKGGSGYNFHLAVMLYFGLHFVSLRGNNLLSMHLLAQIEGNPQLYSSGKLRIQKKGSKV